MAVSAEGRPWLDVHEPASGSPTAVVLLLHGSGPNERDVMAPLAEELTRLGAVVLVPDWDMTAEDVGARLADAAAASVAASGRLGCEQLLVAGWSAGGSAALWLSSTDASFVGLALIATSLGPIAALPTAAPRPVPTVLVTGSTDGVVTSAETGRAADTLQRLDHPLRMVTVDADHAGVIGTDYDEVTRRCRPSSQLTVREAVRATASAILEV